MGLFKLDVDKLESNRDIPGLLKALQYKKDERVREDAAEALGRLLRDSADSAATEPLIAALEDSSASVQERAARALRYLPSDRVVDALIQALGVFGEHHATVIESLGAIGNRKAVDALLQELRGAVQVHSEQRARLSSSFDLHIPFALQVGRALCKFQDARAIAAYLELVATLWEDETLYFQRQQFVDDLEDRGLDRIEPEVFAEVLRDSNPVVLLQCLTHLGNRSPTSGVLSSVAVLRSVLQLLDHPQEEVRGAARGLANCFQSEECLREMALSADPRVRADAEAKLELLATLAAEDEERRRREAAEDEERRRREAAKPQYVKVIESYARAGLSSPYSFDEITDALSAAEGRSDLDPELLSPLLEIYRIATKGAWWEHDDDAWAHIERFERQGARQTFEESRVLKQASLRLIERAARLPGSGPVLARMRFEMQAGMDRYDPMEDSPHAIATRGSFKEAVELIRRLTT